MKTPVTESRRTIFGQQLRSFLMSCLGIAGSALLGFTLEASITHPVFVSWIKDQRNSTGVFDTQYFTVDKYDDTGTVNVTVGSTNPAFMPTPAVAPCLSPSRAND